MCQRLPYQLYLAYVGLALDSGRFAIAHGKIREALTLAEVR